MPLGSTAELDFMLKDAGVAVTYGAQNTYGILDLGTATLQPGTSGFELIESSAAVVIRDGSLANLLEDTPITVAGVAYNIRDIGLPQDDGTRRITLVETSP